MGSVQPSRKAVLLSLRYRTERRCAGWVVLVLLVRMKVEHKLTSSLVLLELALLELSEPLDLQSYNMMDFISLCT
jgi:hypothetical protein